MAIITGQLMSFIAIHYLGFSAKIDSKKRNLHAKCMTSLVNKQDFSPFVLYKHLVCVMEVTVQAELPSRKINGSSACRECQKNIARMNAVHFYSNQKPVIQFHK